MSSTRARTARYTLANTIRAHTHTEREKERERERERERFYRTGGLYTAIKVLPGASHTVVNHTEVNYVI